MSPIGIGLDLLLAGLLVTALFVGLRLDKRLKRLRETQAGFAGAVSELNKAVQKAGTGLSDLKTATREAQADLGDRLTDAKTFSLKLEQQGARAQELAERLERAIEGAPKVAIAREAFLRSTQAREPAPIADEPPYAPEPELAPARAEPVYQAPIRPLAPIVAARAAPPAFADEEEEPLVLRQAALSRVRYDDDDDLFEPVRAAGGAR